MVRVIPPSLANAWAIAGTVPRDMSPTAAVALPRGGGLLGVATGVAGPFEVGKSRSCAILVYTGVTRLVYRAEGQIVGLGLDDYVCFAVRSVLRAGGVAYAGMLSTDEGATWTETGPIAAVSINRLAVSAEGLLIATGGSRTLVASRDFGRSWRAYQAPLPFSAAHEFAAMLNGEPALAGDGLRLLSLGERAEVQQEVLPASVEVMSLRGGLLSALMSKRIRLGIFRPDGINWGPDLAPDRLVLAVAQPAPLVWLVLMRARDPAGGAEFAVARTDDLGQNWTIEEQRLGPVSDIFGTGGIAVEPYSKQILVRNAS